MIQITKAMLSLGPNRPGDIISPRMIIVHRTGNPGTSARVNCNYFESLNHPPLAGKTYASAHYIVDESQIIQCIPENERAHHCIGANHFAIGIETCEPLTQWAYQNLLDLIHDICSRYGFAVTKDYIQPHSKYDPVNRHFDPFCWDDFMVGKTNSGKDLFDPIEFYKDLLGG